VYIDENNGFRLNRSWISEGSSFYVYIDENDTSFI